MALNSANVLVGAANIWYAELEANLPKPVAGESYATTLERTNGGPGGNPPPALYPWRNIGYTTNGLELQFAPEFGEVQVDQALDAVKIFRSGMVVTMNTTMAEATLENLLFATATDLKNIYPGNDTDQGLIPDGGTGLVNTTDSWGANDRVLDLSAGTLGECPLERSLVAIGPGTGVCKSTEKTERIYIAYRVLSIETVTVAIKRDEASTFDVSFRLMPEEISTGTAGTANYKTRVLYGQVIDRKYTPTSS